ncbi:hypothetical protein SAMN04487996_11894 [Dyadobacter soli]|uniref:Uncharacterized protein n=1 Tax=Dyadobacter soli TaxID=659014 RepID=A0A1G7TY23_9BACT|nr:hypothetical protein [Dyadobacter soli]SDG40202.1 hypothetical protein SAMN04487996_11894 [Dyadobacter soli]
MKKPKIVLEVIREEEGFSAVGDVADKFIGTQGDDMEELKQNILEVVNLSFFEDGFSYNMDEIELRLPIEKPESSLH